MFDESLAPSSSEVEGITPIDFLPSQPNAPKEVDQVQPGAYIFVGSVVLQMVEAYNRIDSTSLSDHPSGIVRSDANRRRLFARYVATHVWCKLLITYLLTP